MDIKILKIDNSLLAGLNELASHLSINLSDDGISLSSEQIDSSNLIVSFKDNKIEITYDKPIHFFRAFGLAIEHILAGETEFSLNEKPYFSMNGPMFDLSQASAAFNMSTLKSIIRQLSLMGLNMLMLYTEDNYEVESQPYFGYMRPKYSQKELKELDDYAFNLGIEIIPCIQTLSHLQEVLKWKIYRPIADYDSTLLVGDEKTYDFIRDIIEAASRPFRTKRIHIGMDEAFRLGKGAFLDKFGYKTTLEIMKMHLDRVMEIVREFSLEPMMWDDMFFRTFGTKKYQQPGAVVPEETIKLVPEGMRCVYWCYGGETDKAYDDTIPQHIALDKKFIFAGGAHSWMGYAFMWKKTRETAIHALRSCKRFGVKEVFITTWADHGAEILINVNLAACQLYAELGYAEDYDEEKLKTRLNFCTGGNLDDFKLLEYLDYTPQAQEILNYEYYNNSKHLMWQDILTGLFDHNIAGYETNKHYASLTKKLENALGKNGQFNGLFDMSYRASRVLEMKAEMGIILTKAYRENDIDTLKRYAEIELPELLKRVAELRESHMKNWFELYKPLGWDIFDLRYGGLLARIQTTIYELNAYLSGEFDRLEEFEQERLPFDGFEGPVKYMNLWDKIASPSKIVAKI